MTKIIISIDDGAYDGYKNIFPLLKKYNLPATFSIIPEYIDSEKEFKGIPVKPMTWNEINEIASSGLIEIANHSYDHTNEMKSIIRVKTEINRHLGLNSDECMGFASPESKLSEAEINTKKTSLFNMGCSYVRTGLRIKTFRTLRTFARKAARVVHIRCFYVFAYHDSLLDETDRCILYSVPVMKDTTVREIKALIRYSERRDRNLILLFHRVLKSVEEIHKENWYWDYRKFETLLQFLKKEEDSGKVIVAKTCELRSS